MVKLALKRQVTTLGKPLKASFRENCLACKNYYMCRDPDKSPKYLCSKFSSVEGMWREAERKHAEDLADDEAREKKKRRPESNVAKIFELSPAKSIVTQKDLRTFMREEILRNKIKPGDVGLNEIDDGDMELADNFYQFTMSPRFMKVKDQRPFPKQIEIGVGLNSEYCPRCSDVNWLSDVPVDAPLKQFKSKITLLKKGKCPECGARKSELVRAGELTDHYILAGLAGQRGSKSYTMAMLSSYSLHRYLKLRMPPIDYGLPATQFLTATFVAPTFKQAYDNLWTPLSGLISTSPWFKEYHSMLDDYKEKLGYDLYHYVDTYIKYNHKMLVITPSAADGRTLRGYTRFIAGIDELGWFGVNAKNLKMNADAVFDALNRSMMTVQGAHFKRRKKGDDTLPPPLFGNISSPSSWQDRMCRLVKEAEVDKSIYSFHYATWEMNPDLPKEHPFFAAEKRKNPSTFSRDYEAIPPMSASEFISDIKKFKPLYSEARRNAFIVDRVRGKSSTGRNMTSGFISHRRWSSKTGRCLALDAGLINNSFAGALGRCDPDDGTPIVEAMFEVIPYEGCPINFHDIFQDVVYPIIDRYGVRMVIADRWNSRKFLDDIEAEYGDDENEFVVQQYSLKKPDFMGYRNDIYNGSIVLPPPEIPLKDIIKADISAYPDRFIDKPIAHFYFQNVTVVETPKSVEKGDKLTDDLFRATVLLHRALTEPEYQGMFMGEPEAEIKKTGLGVAVATAGGTSGGTSSAPGIVVLSSG